MSSTQPHLRLLWDHLVQRAVWSESQPSLRIQHLLDDMDLLLATLADFVQACLGRFGEVRQSAEETVLMSMTLSDALGVDRGVWKLKEEDEIPAKYRTMFVERAGDQTEKKRKRQCLPQTFEQAFTTLNQPTKCTTDPNDDHFDLEQSITEESAAPGATMKKRAADCKLIFQIVDQLFVCRAPQCSAGEGFPSLPGLKAHYDEAHQGMRRQVRQGTEEVLDLKPTMELKEEDQYLENPEGDVAAVPVSAETDTRTVSERPHGLGPITGAVAVPSSSQRYEWQRKIHKRCQRSKLYRDQRPRLTATRQRSSHRVVQDTLNLPRRHLLECHVCDFTCRNRLDLESHLKTQHPNVDAFKCDECPFTTNEKKYLVSHRRSKHLLMFRCSVCDHRFGYKNHLETHMASHSTENTVMCHLCGKGFRCGKYLRKHLRFTHAEQNSFLCGECGKSFKHHSSYEAHLKSKHENPSAQQNALDDCISLQT